MTFIQYVFGIRSMRQTIKEIETNMAYRWFLGFGFHTEVPHFSTFGKNYARRFQDTDVFEQIFYRILKEIMKKGLLHADHDMASCLTRVDMLKEYGQLVSKIQLFT